MYENHIELLKQIRMTMVMSQKVSWMTEGHKVELKNNEILIRELIELLDEVQKNLIRDLEKDN